MNEIDLFKFLTYREHFLSASSKYSHLATKTVTNVFIESVKKSV